MKRALPRVGLFRTVNYFPCESMNPRTTQKYLLRCRGIHSGHSILGSNSTAQMFDKYRTFIAQYGIITVPYRNTYVYQTALIFLHYTDTHIFLLLDTKPLSRITSRNKESESAIWKFTHSVRRTLPYSVLRVLLMCRNRANSFRIEIWMEKLAIFFSQLMKK